MKDRADYEVGTLEKKIEIDIGNTQADLQKLISSINTLNSSLSGLLNNNGLKSISQDMKSLKNDTSLVEPLLKNLKELQAEFSRGGKNQLANQIREFTKELYKTEYSKSNEKIEEIRNLIEQKLGHNFVEEFNQSLKETGKSKDLTEKVLNIGDALKATIKLGVIFATLKKGFSIVKDVTKENIDMIETTNLFEVMMGKVVDQYGNLDEAQSKYYLNAIKFQDDMTSKLLVNRRELMETQSMFYSLYKNQGVNKEKSYFLSEQLSKAVYDLSSLYNTDTETMKKALISGITGQVESLRNVAKVDISEMSLQPILDQLGIERSVQQLNYAEKELVRYMAILKQAGQAQGDFARTMDTPAQQIRIFQAQLAELKITAGSFFSGLFGQIMPYVNGFIMAITTILKLLGDVFGFKVESAPVQSSLDGVADTVGDIGSGLGGATKQAKEFKKQLMGFDEINNITPPTQTSGGSGGGGGSVAGIDSRLLEALDDWDNKMESISGKAQEIRDKILKWLGVTDGSYKNLKKILEVAKLVGTAIGAWTIGSTVANFLKNWGKLSRTQAFQLATGITLTITGLVAQFSGTKQLLDGNWTLANIVETAFGTTAGALGIASIIKSLSKGKISFGKGLTISFGIMLAFQALQVIADGIQKDDIVKQIIGALEGGFAGTLLLSSKAGKGLFGKLKLGLNIAIAILEIEVAVDMVKWWNQYFEEEKKLIYGDKKELNFFEMINVGFSAIGEGAVKNIIEPLFGKGALEPVIKWVANVMIWFEKLGDNIENWWTTDVAPWFTKEKWQELGENIKKALSNKWNEFKEWWGNTAIVQWWRNNVTPWFAKEKWLELGQNAKKSLEDKFNEWKEKFNVIKQWIDEKVKPWFTIEKWKETANNAKKGLEEKFNEIKNKISDIWSKIGNSTTKSWKNITSNAKTGAKNAWSGIKSVFSSVGSFFQNTFSNAWTKVKNVFSKGGKVFTGIKEGIAETFKSIVNSLIGGINKIIAKPFNKINEALNSIRSINIPIVGQVFSGLPTIDIPEIPPLLAQGAYVKANNPMLAIIGDNKTQGEFVAPEDKLRKLMQEEIEKAISNIKNILNKKVKINPKDFETDTKQYINYDIAKSQIQTQNQVNMHENIANMIAEAVTQSMRNAELNINIEAKTDEGIIFKKVQKSANQYYKQTGKPAFGY